MRVWRLRTRRFIDRGSGWQPLGELTMTATGRPPTPLELEAQRIDARDHRGVAGRVVEFDGDLALLIGGGGASLTVFDAIKAHGGNPANYCEVGGNPTEEKVAAITSLLLSKPGVKRDGGYHECGEQYPCGCHRPRCPDGC